MAEISLINVEHELNRLWESVEAKNKVKAALFNLIVYLKDPRRTDYVDRVTQFVLQRFPCRTIFLIADPEAKEEYLRITASVKTIGEGDQPISCDQIHIAFSATLRKRVPFLIFPHLLPDLPVVVLWEGDPTDEPTIFPVLEQCATRLIFDPDCLEELPEFARFIMGLTERFSGDIADQKWGSTEGWRNVMRQAFRTQENIDHIKKMHTLRIEYTTGPTDFPRDPRIQAIYLQGWLAAQLEWHFEKLEESKDSTQLFYQSCGERVTVALVPRENESEPFGAISMVDLMSGGGAHFNFTHEPSGHFVRVKSDSPEKCDLPYTLYLPHVRREESFAHEVLRTGMSRHYYNMLRELAKISL
jgi:Glucose-6-phosphate dehydrogenase subunit N-terminal domain